MKLSKFKLTVPSIKKVLPAEISTEEVERCHETDLEASRPAKITASIRNCSNELVISVSTNFKSGLCYKTFFRRNLCSYGYFT